jgi:hypothetical protein
MKRTARVLSFAIASLAFSLNSVAHPLSKEECVEGSDFIKNAALSRENGMDGMTFLAKMLADIAAIRAFPPDLRWFVQDQHDEDYLLKAITDVFENPQEPQAHQRHFLGECLTRTSSLNQ